MAAAPEEPKMEVEEVVVVEHEQDQPELKKKAKSFASGTIKMNSSDSTLNTLVDCEGSNLMQVHADGMGSLISQSRATHGIKKGRYYFEFQVLESNQRYDFKIGVSTATANFVGGEDSIAFTNLYRMRTGGETEAADKKLPIHKKHDVVGILVNLDSKATNKNTVSLFVNGVRSSEPKALPESMIGQVLYPHVSFKNCSVALYFENQMKALPFTVCMMGAAACADLEKSKIDRVESPTSVFPVGLDTDAFVKDFVKKNPTYLELSSQYFTQWCAESQVNKRNESFYGVQCLDNPLLLAQWLRIRQRHVIIALGNTIFAKDRASKLQVVPTHNKKCVVLELGPLDSAGRVFTNFADASLPTAEEGFEIIDYITSEEKEQANLELWKKDQKLRSKVDDLKPGEYFKTKTTEWTKFVAEKKSTDEGKKFSPEDWMLANLRAEMVNLVHGFKEDVNDEERPSFPPTLIESYYKTYLNKNLNAQAFACKTIEELLKEHLTDCVTLDDKGLLETSIAKDTSADKIFELVDAAREIRETRVFSGDELFDLKFSVNMKPGAIIRTGKGQQQGQIPRPNKGGAKGQQKGFKRPMTFPVPAAQRKRVA